jgi:hypothetical protein
MSVSGFPTYTVRKDILFFSLQIDDLGEFGVRLMFVFLLIFFIAILLKVGTEDELFYCSGDAVSVSVNCPGGVQRG